MVLSIVLDKALALGPVVLRLVLELLLKLRLGARKAHGLVDFLGNLPFLTYAAPSREVEVLLGCGVRL